MRKKEAYVLVTTVIILGALSTVFVLQNIAFNEQLRAQAKLIQLTKINVLQARLSLLYATNGDKSLMFDGIMATVDDQEICVSIQGRQLKVPLLVK